MPSLVAGPPGHAGLIRLRYPEWFIPGGGRAFAPMKTVMFAMFACVHNAGRSQMAAGWFNALADPASARAVSAGTQPAERVQAEVLAAMDEVGIDLSSARPQLLTEQLAKSATLLVTMGCGESCPVVPGVERQDWPLADPKGQSLQRVREIREEIRRRVIELINAKGWERE